MSWYNDCGPVSRGQAERAGERAFERGGSWYGYPDYYPPNRQRDFSYGYRAAQEEHMREEAARRDAAQRDEWKRLDEEEEARHYLEECQEDEESESEGLHTSVDGWGEDDLNG